MTWSRFDDGYDEKERIEEAWFAFPPNPVGLHAMATTACSRWQSDGVIKPRWLMARLPERKMREQILAAMVKGGLFDLLNAGETCAVVDGDGDEVVLGPFEADRYIVHGFLRFHDSVAKHERNKEWDRRRKELERDHDLIAAIRERDNDRCRYCGQLVNWRDRRGSKGGTYDHVIPHGDNSLENVVVACRGCKSAKGPRTPDRARMPVLPPGQIPGQVPARSGVETSGRDLGLSYPTLPYPTLPLKEEPPQPPTSGGSRDTRGSAPPGNSRANRTNPRAVARHAAVRASADNARRAAAALDPPADEHREAWVRVHRQIRESVGDAPWSMRFSHLALVGVDPDGRLVIGAPSETYSWVQGRFARVIPDAGGVVGVPVRLTTPAENDGLELRAVTA